MNILIRKLIYNEADLHLILWNDKPCFFVSELSKAFDGVNKEDIPVFLRSGGSALKGIDYDVVGGAEARDLRSYLENSGIKKKFAHTMIIYIEGLQKYFNFRKTVECRDFINYLEKNKISLQAEPVPEVPQELPKVAAVEVQAPVTKKRTVASSQDTGSYSDFLKHISFMEEFVDAFNKLNIPADKSIAFTKGMAKYLEDNGIKAADFLKEIKKWIV